MRSRKKQILQHRLFHNMEVQPTIESPVIQWKTTPKIPITPITTNFQTAPTPPLVSESIDNSNSSAKHIIKALLTQNSELRKVIYHLEHSMAIMRLNMQNKELEYKNTIFEYREMIGGFVESMGYSSIEEYQKSFYLQEKDSSWESRRLHLYQKYQGEGVRNKQKFDKQDSSNYFQSRKSRSLNKSISINIDQDSNQSGIDPQKVQLVEKKPFTLDPCDFLNFGSSANIEPVRHQNQKINTYSSVTQILHPLNPQNFVQIDQVPTMNNEPKHSKETAHVSKAETQRIEKVSMKDKKSSGRVSSQAVYSNQSFKIIVQKGLKNRQRIEQLFGKLKAT